MQVNEAKREVLPEAGSPGAREKEAAGNQRVFTLEDIKKMQRNTASRPPHRQSDTYLRR